jgi:hypothetical protein
VKAMREMWAELRLRNQIAGILTAPHRPRGWIFGILVLQYANGNNESLFAYLFVI